MNATLLAAGRVAFTLAIGIAGSLVFYFLGLPAPWISGALVGVVIGMTAGFRPVVPDPLRDFGMLLAGAVTGSAITPDMIRAAARYPWSLVILALTTAGIVFAGRAVLIRMFGWESRSALFAAMPGALSAVIAAVGEIGGDMMRVMAVQSFRMFVLVALLPSTVMVAATEFIVPAAAPLSASGFALTMAAAFATALLFNRLSMMAPFLLGGMAGAGLLHATGVVHGAPPAMIAALAMLLVGVYAGARLAGLDLMTLRRLFLPGLVLFLVTGLIAFLGGMLAARVAGVSYAEAMVAFAPGGLEAMVMLGLAMGLDPLFVSSHHVARFVMIAAALPLIAKMVRPK